MTRKDLIGAAIFGLALAKLLDGDSPEKKAIIKSTGEEFSLKQLEEEYKLLK